MATAKLSLDPELAYIQKVLQEGRASLQLFSLAAIGKPDFRFQARVKHIDMEHVRLLASKRDAGAELDPIIIFRSACNPKVVHIADGYHRHEEARIRGDSSIRAYIVDSTDIESETLLYSTMCNQRAYLKRTPEDTKKAAYMLFALPEWWANDDRVIASHIGVGVVTVESYRACYSVENKIPLPTHVVNADGRWRSTVKALKHPSGMLVPRLRSPESSVGKGHEGPFYARVSGELVEFPGSKADAEKKLVKVVAENYQKLVKDGDIFSYYGFEGFLKKYRIPFSPHLCNAPGFNSQWWFAVHDSVVVPCRVSKGGDLPSSVGVSLIARGLMKPDSKYKNAVVVCNLALVSEDVRDVVKDAGVFLMAPEQFAKHCTDQG